MADSAELVHSMRLHAALDTEAISEADAPIRSRAIASFSSMQPANAQFNCRCQHLLLYGGATELAAKVIVLVYAPARNLRQGAVRTLRDRPETLPLGCLGHD